MCSPWGVALSRKGLPKKGGPCYFLGMSKIENFNFSLTGPTNSKKWVFLHGLMGYAANWRKIIYHLEKNDQCLAYDQRGHGRSFKPESGYAPENYADDLLEITKNLAFDKFILVGHSMGGRNALNFAYRFPEKVQCLIIEDIGPEADASASNYYFKLLDSIPTPFTGREDAKSFFKNEFYNLGTIREKTELLANYLYSNLEEKEDGSWDWRFSKNAIIESMKVGRSSDRWNEIQGLKMPTLFIRGENSKEFSRQTFEKVLQANPKIEGIEIPSAGHWVHADQPKLFLEAITDFVNRKLK